MLSQENSHSQESRPTLPEKQAEISSDQIHVNQIWESSTPLSKCSGDVWEEFVSQFKVTVSLFVILPKIIANKPTVGNWSFY